GAGPGVGEISGEAVGHQIAYGVCICDDETLEAECPAQHIDEQPAVAGRGNPVEVHVRGHHVPGAGLERGPERRQVDVPQLGVGEVDLVVVATADRGAVPGEV